ncbi:hypothetical protein AAY473_010988 [Plecturocebus cupreus]
MPVVPLRSVKIVSVLSTGTVAHTYNPSTLEGRASGSLAATSLRSAWPTCILGSQCGRTALAQEFETNLGNTYLLQLLVFMGHGEQHGAVAYYGDFLPEGAAGGHGEALQVRLGGDQGLPRLPRGARPGCLCQAVQPLLALDLLIQDNITIFLVKQLGCRAKEHGEEEKQEEGTGRPHPTADSHKPLSSSRQNAHLGL